MPSSIISINSPETKKQVTIDIKENINDTRRECYSPKKYDAVGEVLLNKRCSLKKNALYHSYLCSRCQFSGTKICSRWVNKGKIGEIVNLSLCAIFAGMKLEHETHEYNEAYLLLLSLVGIESLVTQTAADRIPLH